MLVHRIFFKSGHEGKGPSIFAAIANSGIRGTEHDPYVTNPLNSNLGMTGWQSIAEIHGERVYLTIDDEEIAVCYRSNSITAINSLKHPYGKLRIPPSEPVKPTRPANVKAVLKSRVGKNRGSKVASKSKRAQPSVVPKRAKRRVPAKSLRKLPVHLRNKNRSRKRKHS